MGVEDSRSAGGHVPGGPVPGGDVPRGHVPGGDPIGGDGGASGGASGGPYGAPGGIGAGRPPSTAAPTGDERVDEALTPLGALGRAPVSGHVEIFREVHQRLQDVLSSIDQDGPAPTPPRP